MQNLLDENISAQIRGIFTNLQNPVHLIFFGSKRNCDACEDTRKLVEEVAALSDKLSLSIYDLDGNADAAFRYQMDKAPVRVLLVMV